MDNQGAHLTQDALGYVARALRGNADVERRLSSLFCDQLEGVQRIARILFAQGLVEEIMRLVQKHKERTFSELAAARHLQQVSPKGVSHDLPCVVGEGKMFQRNAQHARGWISDKRLQLIKDHSFVPGVEHAG